MSGVENLKPEIIEKLKKQVFTDKEKSKYANLIEALHNATGEEISFTKHSAQLQVGYMNLDVTVEGFRTDGDTTSRKTINSEINSARHIWLVSGDKSVAEKSELRNGLSRFKSNCCDNGNYIYRAGNEAMVCKLFLDNYGRDYFNKLNMVYSPSNSRVNIINFVPESDPYDLNYYVINFTYKNKKGVDKVVTIGYVYEEDLSDNVSFEIIMPWQEKKTNKWIIPVTIVLAVFAIVFIIYKLLT